MNGIFVGVHSKFPIGNEDDVFEETNFVSNDGKKRVIRLRKIDEYCYGGDDERYVGHSIYLGIATVSVSNSGLGVGEFLLEGAYSVHDAFILLDEKVKESLEKESLTLIGI
jgi:hypothetical protein